MSINRNSPPSLPLRFFRWYCHPKLLKYIEGDLMELYEERKVKTGKLKADIRFVMDVIFLFRPSIIKPADGYQQLNNYAMFKNYFKVGIRNILKYKVFSFINIFGLAVAMSVSMLIILMLADQGRYDQFHKKKDRIYRILSDYQGSRQPYATSPFPLARALKADYPIVEETTNLTPGIGGDAIYGQRLADMRGYFAEPSFFDIFSFELAMGDESSALSRPYSMIISSEMAYQLFNHENPIGKTVEFSDRQLPFPQRMDGVAASAEPWGSFTVTGVIDESAYVSHLKFDVLISSSTRQSLITEKKIEDLSNNWEWYFRSYTYVLLKNEKKTEDLSLALKDLVARKYADLKSDQVKGFKLEPQQLSAVQLGLAGNDTNNRMPMLGYYFLIILATVIMITACLNYTNLSIARALTRAKEIGIRKVTGAAKKSLVFQFLSESIITALLALAMAVGLLAIIKPAFKGLWVNQYLNFELPSSVMVYVIFTGFALLIGVIAGSYPALHLSNYQPVQALKNLNNVQPGKLGLRKVLTVSQFVISLFFITTSILIFNQFKHYMQFDYGFHSENIINIELQGVNYQQLSNELSALPEVSAISATDIIPATGRSNGMRLKKVNSKEDDFVSAYLMNTDDNFINNLGLKIIAGANLPPSGETTNKYLVVNEATVKKLGYKFPDEIVGEVLDGDWKIVGVVKDFRYNLLINTHEIKPLALANQSAQFQYLNVKVTSTDLMATVEKLQSKWKNIDPIHPFKYEFFDDQLASTHKGIFDLVSILSFIAFLAIMIACLGLLGMATYTAERKTKEVGIRKILGAEDFSIALLLSKGFLRMLGVSILIGAPLSYFINNLWLQKFPNRVEFGWGTVFLGTVVLLVLGLITIGSQTLRASKNNPVDALKME